VQAPPNTVRQPAEKAILLRLMIYLCAGIAIFRDLRNFVICARHADVGLWPMLDDSTLTHALALTPLPSLVVDARSGDILMHNALAEPLFAAPLAGRNLSGFLSSKRSRVAVFLEATLHFGSYLDTTLAFHRADGTALRLQTYGTALSDGGAPTVLLTFLDLEAQERRQRASDQDAHLKAGLLQWQSFYGFFKEVEAQNRLILDAAGEGIYGINAEGKATFVNRAAQDMLGWDAEDLIGRELHSIIHHHHLNGDVFPPDECPIYHTFRKDKTQRVENDAFWRKDGKPILVEYVSTPIYDQNLLAGAVVIFRDVTERKENERKLREALAEVEALRQELEQENDYLLTEIRSERSHMGIVGRSAAIRNLNAQIDLVAGTATNILITGASGTGKSLAVSAIHEASNRRKRPLVKLDCSATARHTLDADFFGYRKGAFRGAVRDTAGQIALAQNGTLHIDEVSELPPDFQAKLMNVLQDGTYRRLGDTTDIPVSLTIVSTTARDLQAEVAAGRFRQDLYFALSVFPIRCDPLKQRPDDIPYLAQHFLDLATRRLRLPAARLSRANIDALLGYDWPGNVRELQNVIERAAILARGGKLRFRFEDPSDTAPRPEGQILSDADIRRIERENLVACLRRCKGRVSGAAGAASLLGLPPTTVYSRVKALGIARAEWYDGIPAPG